MSVTGSERIATSKNVICNTTPFFSHHSYAFTISPSCPRLDEVPMLEPLICKKISHERLTSLVFRDDCFVTACQEGFVCTWARPGKWVRLSLFACRSIADPSLVLFVSVGKFDGHVESYAECRRERNGRSEQHDRIVLFDRQCRYFLFYDRLIHVRTQARMWLSMHVYQKSLVAVLCKLSNKLVNYMHIQNAFLINSNEEKLIKRMMQNLKFRVVFIVFLFANNAYSYFSDRSLCKY